MSEYSLSGVWRVLQRAALTVRSAQVQHYSPDPEYLPKLARLEECLRELGGEPLGPQAKVLMFCGEMDYLRWPAAAPSWAERAPVPPAQAERAGDDNQQWRIIGALNARTGLLDYLDGYIVGGEKVIALYRKEVCWARA